MQHGNVLDLKAARRVDSVCEFLKATVADHQYDYPETADHVVERWAEEFGVRAIFPDYDARETVMDCALYPAVQEPVMRAKFGEGPDSIYSEPRVLPSKGQNTMAGYYIDALMRIAGLGQGRTPVEIVKHFYEKSQETGAA